MKDYRIELSDLYPIIKGLSCFSVWLVFRLSLSAATFTWDGGSGGGTAWLTGANWDLDSVPGTTDEAYFGSTGTANSIGINLGSSSVNNGANNQAVGSIALLAANTRARTIENSSGTANGYLTLNGSSGTLLANSSAKDLTIRDGATATMGVVLAASGEVVVNSSGNIVISSIISETGGARSINKTGDGALILGGNNTYTGGTILSAGTVQLGADGALGTGSLTFAGGSLSAQNHTATLNTLTLSSGSSILNLVSDGTPAALNFSGSSYIAGSLMINGWDPGATHDPIYINSVSSPSSTFLDAITFAYNGATAAWDPTTHELYASGTTPIPEPIHYALGVFGFLFAGVRLGRSYLARRRKA